MPLPPSAGSRGRRDGECCPVSHRPWGELQRRGLRPALLSQVSCSQGSGTSGVDQHLALPRVVLGLRARGRRRATGAEKLTRRKRGVQLSGTGAPSPPTCKPPQWDAAEHGTSLLGLRPVDAAHVGHHHGGVHGVDADLGPSTGRSVTVRPQGLPLLPPHPLPQEPLPCAAPAPAPSSWSACPGHSSYSLQPVAAAGAEGDPAPAPGRRTHVLPSPSLWRGPGGAMLTVDGVALQSPLRGLAGDVHNGSRRPPCDQLPGHDLRRGAREREAPGPGWHQARR